MARILNTGFASAIDVVNHISCQISCHSSRMVCSRDAEHEYFSWCLPCFIPSMWYCFRTQTMQLLTHSGLSQNQRSRTSVVWWLPSGFPQWLSRKESTYKAGDAGDLASVPESGGSPGGGDDNPLRYPCLENPMGWGAWWATVPGVTKSQKQPKRLRPGI